MLCWCPTERFHFEPFLHSVALDEKIEVHVSPEMGGHVLGHSDNMITARFQVLDKIVFAQAAERFRGNPVLVDFKKVMLGEFGDSGLKLFFLTAEAEIDFAFGNPRPGIHVDDPALGDLPPSWLAPAVTCGHELAGASSDKHAAGVVVHLHCETGAGMGLAFDDENSLVERINWYQQRAKNGDEGFRLRFVAAGQHLHRFVG